ncbi:LytR/AlgR family response regulator transcription factor [Paenibacillus hamazuiensis]|uniref:LytR/AlgR family response regulator transcription factor n=1 Tax=Paenibacillus hamazuiensis TaxID=2936508 RepID=UPI00200C5DB8|nr:LytTR family DNA-binding domain-containing protein [Paenibacillus hamazuiensis]
MFIKTMIIDDEPAVCSELEYMLQKYIDLRIVAVRHNPLEALPQIIELEPDLLFLDIEMPGMNGLELAKKLNQMPNPPFIIFSTAFQEYALEAFDTPAVSYLTKPIMEQKLDDAIKKVKSLQARSKISEGKGYAGEERICVRKQNRLIPISVGDIRYAYVEEKELFVATKDSVAPCDLSLHELEAILNKTGYFFRTHRNYIVNLKHIVEIVPWFHSTYLLTMNEAGRTKVPVSRGKIKAFRSMMNL